MKAILFAAVAFLAMTGTARADHIEDHQFLATTDRLEKADSQTVFDRDEKINALTPEQVSNLEHVASEQAQIWGDTILEGDYQADGQTILDRVEELKLEGELVAYKITYSERSWDTSACTYPGNRDSSALEQCQEGRIVESSFVSPELNELDTRSSKFRVI